VWWRNSCPAIISRSRTASRSGRTPATPPCWFRRRRGAILGLPRAALVILPHGGSVVCECVLTPVERAMGIDGERPVAVLRVGLVGRRRR
jgi:hypothetical protein